MVKVDSFVKLHLMMALNNGETYGYELMKNLESKLGKKVSAANIYPFLKELKQNKLVVCKQEGREKIYSLTRQGKAFTNNILLKFNELIQESLKNKLTK